MALSIVFYESGAPQFTKVVAGTIAKHASTPENYMRKMREHGLTDLSSSAACDFIEGFTSQRDMGPFDGSLGFSEGASAIASMMLRQGNSSRFNFAIFFCGTPPLWNQVPGMVPADETTERINLPTAHIVGSRDPGFQGSLAPYNLCNKDSRQVFDHGGSHTVPWDSSTTQGIDC